MYVIRSLRGRQGWEIKFEFDFDTTQSGFGTYESLLTVSSHLYHFSYSDLRSDVA